MMQVLAGALLISFALWLLNQSGNSSSDCLRVLLVFAAIYIGATQEAKAVRSSVDSNEGEAGIYSRSCAWPKPGKKVLFL